MEKKQYRKRYHQHKTIANTVNTSTTSHKFFFKQFSTYASKEIHMEDKVKRFKVPFAYAAHVSVAHSFLTTKANANIQYTLMYPPCQFRQRSNARNSHIHPRIAKRYAKFKIGLRQVKSGGGGGENATIGRIREKKEREARGGGGGAGRGNRFKLPST